MEAMYIRSTGEAPDELEVEYPKTVTTAARKEPPSFAAPGTSYIFVNTRRPTGGLFPLTTK